MVRVAVMSFDDGRADDTGCAYLFGDWRFCGDVNWVFITQSATITYIAVNVKEGRSLASGFILYGVLYRW